jgi:hypothetical protein
MRLAASSATRWSMPSYRPQANTRCRSAVHRCAVAWSNSRPAGVGTTNRVSAVQISSSASPHTGAFITMPGPPP